MTCERAADFLETTIGDTLDPADVGVPDADAMRAHVAECTDCTKLRDEIRAGAAAAARLWETDAAGDAALVAAVRTRLTRHAFVRTRNRDFAIAAAALVAVTAGIALLVGSHRPAPPSSSARAIDVAAAPVSGPGFVPGYEGPHFVDVTADSGIVGVDHTGVAGNKDWMVETVGHGACAFDYDGDGRVDLFVPDGNRLDPAQHVRDGWRLYHNDGGMHFTDVTKGSGLECDAWAGGAVAGDVNGDGLPDLFVPCFGKNHLFLNRGGGKFEDVTDAAGVGGLDSEWSTAACMADFDGDGTLDIFVSNYADMRRFMSEATGPRGCKWREMPVACGPQPLEPQQDRLYLNRGDGTFVDATATNLPKIRRYSFQCVALDLNGDGAPDVFVACDGHPNLLFINDGHGHFTEEAMAAGIAADGTGKDTAGMGVAAGDVDGDGLTDIFQTNFSHEPNTLHRARTRGGVPAFTDVTAAAGLVEPDALLGWGASFFDFDCDGSLDLMFANGHLYPGVQESVPTTAYEQPLSLYRNDGTGRFREITASAGPALVKNRVHRGLVVADFDDDGRLDAFVTVLNGPPLLLRNDGKGCGNSIRFLLRRKGGRVEAGGAHVVVTTRGAAGERRMSRDLLIGSSFGSCEDPRLFFGLGSASQVEAVEVRWPFGATQTFGPMAAGRLWGLTEGVAEPALLK
jgi:hypothetical protein